MKAFLFFCLLSGSCHLLQAQQFYLHEKQKEEFVDTLPSPRMQSFTSTVLGNWGFLSFHYDHTLLQNHWMRLRGTAGLGWIPGSHETDTIPGYASPGIGVLYELGGKQNRLVLGLSYIGLIKYSSDKAYSSIKHYTNVVVSEISYARYFLKEGLFIRLSYTPALLPYQNFISIPFGFSLGASL